MPATQKPSRITRPTPGPCPFIPAARSNSRRTLAPELPGEKRRAREKKQAAAGARSTATSSLLTTELNQRPVMSPTWPSPMHVAFSYWTKHLSHDFYWSTHARIRHAVRRGPHMLRGVLVSIGTHPSTWRAVTGKAEEAVLRLVKTRRPRSFPLLPNHFSDCVPSLWEIFRMRLRFSSDPKSDRSALNNSEIFNFKK